MVKMTGIAEPPVFSPIVGDFYAGMVVTVPLHGSALGRNVKLADIKEAYEKHYEGEKLIKIMDEVPEDGFIHGDILAGSNIAEIFVTGNDERPLLVSRFDNLGKGASGAAVQNMNIMLGIEETKGLK
jgi:N-acetyl-gamma-glutamyl-phosphate reductase